MSKAEWKAVRKKWVSLMEAFVAESERRANLAQITPNEASHLLLEETPEILDQIKEMLIEDYRLAEEIENDQESLSPLKLRAEATKAIIEKCLQGKTSYREYQEYWHGIFV